MIYIGALGDRSNPQGQDLAVSVSSHAHGERERHDLGLGDESGLLFLGPLLGAGAKAAGQAAKKAAKASREAAKKRRAERKASRKVERAVRKLDAAERSESPAPPPEILNLRAKADAAEAERQRLAAELALVEAQERAAIRKLAMERARREYVRQTSPDKRKMARAEALMQKAERGERLRGAERRALERAAKKAGKALDAAKAVADQTAANPASGALRRRKAQAQRGPARRRQRLPRRRVNRRVILVGPSRRRVCPPCPPCPPRIVPIRREPMVSRPVIIAPSAASRRDLDDEKARRLAHLQQLGLAPMGADPANYGVEGLVQVGALFIDTDGHEVQHGPLRD